MYWESDKTISSVTLLSNSLCDYISTVGIKPASEMPSSKKIYLERSTIKQNSLNSALHSHTNIYEILSMINIFKPRKDINDHNKIALSMILWSQ